jgi:hypothetical protein
MAGFFSLMKAMNKCTNELLTIGKDYALKFKSGEITAQEYESEMVGKIYEISNKYAQGDEDLEKHLKQHFSDAAVKFLKEGIQLYTDSLQGPQGTPTSPSPDTSTPSSGPEVSKEPKSKFEKSLDDISSSNKGITSSKNVKSLINDVLSLL